MIVTPSLNVPQARFLALPHKFRAFVGGYGSGKTWVGCAAICQHAWEWPRVSSAYFAPTFGQVRDIFYPCIEAVAADWGLRAMVLPSNHEVHLYRGSSWRATVLCRSLERPASIVGFSVGHALVDELDLLPLAKAEECWRRIMARMRLRHAGLRNGVDVTTTPEGFKFVYQQFVKRIREQPELAGHYGMVQASTYDNARNLPSDYIESLRESYPAQLVEAYLHGQFVNLAAGAVYSAFCREKNNCDDTIIPGEPLYIGMDFNVGQMAAVVHVLRDGLPRAVDEIMGAVDTPAMVQRLKQRYGPHADIRIYPDASGGSRRSVNASVTDIALLQAAGFKVLAPSVNPPVKDRVNAMQALFCNAAGERRYKVNVRRCPQYVECLEQQVWAANGEPDKTQNVDHANDAAGYFIHQAFPIQKPTPAQRVNLPFMVR